MLVDQILSETRLVSDLAYRRDGQNLTIRDKGPFILIYPFNKFKKLNQQIYINRSVWQINEIHIE